MRAVSDRLQQIVASSHTTRARARVVTGFPQSVTPAAGAPLRIVGGDVRMESSAIVRATIDVTVMAPWASFLPDGAELFVEYGVEVAGGATEWVSLGYFRIETITQTEPGLVRVQGSDRMAQVVDSEAVWSWVAPRGATHADLFYSLMFGETPNSDPWWHPNAGAFPNDSLNRDIIYDYDATTTLTSQEIPFDDFENLFKAMKLVADSVGKRLFFDYLGRLNVVDDAVPVNAAPVATVTAGRGGNLRAMTRQVTRDGVYNSVRVEGSQLESGSTPWHYALMNTGGPLSWYGAFGRVLHKFASPLLTTNEQCQWAAETILAKVRGLPYTLSLDTVANPALEPLDPILVRFLADSLTDEPRPWATMNAPVQEQHVIDTLRFPLSGGDMSITTRGTTVGGV